MSRPLWKKDLENQIKSLKREYKQDKKHGNNLIINTIYDLEGYMKQLQRIRWIKRYLNYT